ncbi:hypothetical protein [Parvibaculum sp.]|uniref:hypothetical protein n=1 Tax=Parvibaculum sp. TaxID=2024848 RepID=UPI003BAAE40A
MKMTLWSMCIYGPTGSGFSLCIDPLTNFCSATATMLKAARAFGLIAIGNAVAAALAGLITFAPSCAGLLGSVKPHVACGGNAVGAAIFSLIALSLSVSMYTEGQCGAEPLSTSGVLDLGPSVPLLAAGCVLCLVVAGICYAVHRSDPAPGMTKDEAERGTGLLVISS